LAEEEEAYQQYYTFGEGSFYNAGNLVRIYNGAAPATALPATESVDLYANHLTDIASPEGTVFRLKGPQGEILYTFVLYKDTVFNALTTHIIRNEDGTRLFVFMPDGALPYSSLDDGLYQCTFTYRRDIGEEQPVLKRFGFSQDEQAIIRFSLPVAFI
jgi:hypothetical protein